MDQSVQSVLGLLEGPVDQVGLAVPELASYKAFFYFYETIARATNHWQEEVLYSLNEVRISIDP